MSVCERSHINTQCWDSLPDSDNIDNGCDRCPACAFEQGYIDSISSRQSNFNLYIDPNPLYSHGRLKKWSGTLLTQKNCRHAYNLGYALGENMFRGVWPQ